MSDGLRKATNNEAEVPSLGDVLPDDYVTPRNPEECDEQCPGCGYDFDSDEWNLRHIHGGPSLGEDWKYTCPSCDRETIEVGI